MMPRQPEDKSLFEDPRRTPDEAAEGSEQGNDASGAETEGGRAAAGPENADSPVTGAGEEGVAASNSGAVDMQSMQSELEESRARVLRVQAELENYRKRAQRTLQEERQYAGLPLMRDLLGVVDNLQRAIEAAQEAVDTTQQGQTSAGLLEGVKMVAEQLDEILKKHHCEEIPAEDAQFDPNVHEAVAQIPSDEHEPGRVMQVTQVGYRLHNRVIRPAQVIVAAAKPNEDQGEEE